MKSGGGLREIIAREMELRKETKTDMTKADLQHMLESFTGIVEVVADESTTRREDMCKATWTSLGGVKICNVVNPVERAKSVMEVLKR